MAAFVIERELDSSKSVVWEKLSDFGNAHFFHPGQYSVVLAG